MRIIKLISIIFVFLFSVYCCESQEKCEPKEIWYRFEFKKMFFNAETSFSFEIITGTSTTKIEKYLFLEPPKIIHDLKEGNINYFIAMRKRMSIGVLYRYYNAEIHLKENSDLNPGIEDHGKFGKYKWSEIQ